MDIKLKLFLIDLKKVLVEHEVEINVNWADCSDMYGVDDLHIEFIQKEKTLGRTHEDESYIDVSLIDELLKEIKNTVKL